MAYDTCTVKNCHKKSYWKYTGWGEDTFDFSVCKDHMYKLWKFLGEKIDLDTEDDNIKWM